MEKTETGKVRVVGVRFRTAGKIYYFDPGDFELSRGMHVVVETARGMEYGFVVGTPMEVDEKNIQQPLKSVIRVSTPEDDEREKRNKEREREAFLVCRDRIQQRDLEMKLIDAEYTFDDGKILFYFTADGRIDFRELVKDLASVFRTRIELRQVGVRDEAKILGGYGSCGRPLCCHTWLSDFVPVSIKMAKEQNLSLNPGKISGVCGRLMCCLKNESETYEELNKTLPHPGDEVEAADGMNGLVESVNILRQTARIIVEVDDEKELHDYSVSDLTIIRRRRRGTSRPTMQKNVPAKNPAKDNAEKDHSGKDGFEKEQSAKDHPGKAGTGKENSEKEAGQRDAGRDSRKDAGKESFRESAKESARESNRESAKEGIREAASEISREPGRDSDRESGRDSDRESRKSSGRSGRNRDSRNPDNGRDFAENSRDSRNSDNGRESRRQDSDRESKRQDGDRSSRRQDGDRGSRRQDTSRAENSRTDGGRVEGRRAQGQALEENGKEQGRKENARNRRDRRPDRRFGRRGRDEQGGSDAT